MISDSHSTNEPPCPIEVDSQPLPVRVVATIGLMFGLAAVSCLPYSLVPFVDGQWVISPQKTSWMDLWVLVSTIVGLGLGSLLLLSSIGCFSLVWWARPGMLLWAGSSALWGIVAAFFYLHWFLPSFRANIGDVRAEGPWGGLVFWAIGWIFSVFVLFFMTRPRVKAEFALGPIYGPGER